MVPSSVVRTGLLGSNRGSSGVMVLAGRARVVPAIKQSFNMFIDDLKAHETPCNTLMIIRLMTYNATPYKISVL